MDFDEQTDAFRFDLENLIERYLREFDINTFTIVGALHEKMTELSERGEIDFDPGEDFFADDGL
jgi:hypothetical protein